MSCQVTMDEVNEGLQRLNLRPPVWLTPEDWAAVTCQERLCFAPGVLDLHGWRAICRQQLHLQVRPRAFILFIIIACMMCVVCGVVCV